MPATVSQVMDGVAARLATISGLRTSSYQPLSLNPPCAYPLLDGVEYHNAFQGGDVRYNVTAVVIVGSVSDRLAHSRLNGYLAYNGASSIRLALEGDPTLGGVAQTLIVSRSANIRGLSVGEAEFLSIEITMQVHG